PGDCGRVRVWEDHDGPIPSAPDTEASGAYRAGQNPAARGEPARQERERDATDTGESYLDDPPGPPDLPESGVYHRQPTDRGAQDPPREPYPGARATGHQCLEAGPGRGS